MKIIKDYINIIDEELEDAKKYAEMYVDAKVKEKARDNGEHYWSDRFKEMSLDELKHSEYTHELAVIKIEELNTVYVPPAEMLEVWNKAHIEYVDKASWIKKMLSM